MCGMVWLMWCGWCGVVGVVWFVVGLVGLVWLVWCGVGFRLNNVNLHWNFNKGNFQLVST